MTTPTVNDTMLLLWRMENDAGSVTHNKEDVAKARAILDLISEWFPKETLDWFMDMTEIKPYEVDWK